MIKELEIQMWEAAKSNDAKAFLRLVDENAVMVCGGFRCSGKDYAEIIREFDLEKYDIIGFEVIHETENFCQVHYVIETFVSKPENKDLAGKFHITSTWVKNTDAWKLVFNMDSRIIDFT